MKSNLKGTVLNRHVDNTYFIRAWFRYLRHGILLGGIKTI